MILILMVFVSGAMSCGESDLKLNYYWKCRPEDGFYRCNNGKCISRHEYGAYLEDPCTWKIFNTTTKPIKCTRDEIKCRITSRCIPRGFLETACGCKMNATEQYKLVCRPNEFTCVKSKKCILRHQVGNGVENCNTLEIQDNSDEVSLLECHESEFACDSGQCIPREWVYDGDEDCFSNTGQSSDELEPLTQCLPTEFACKNDKGCVKRYRVLDGHRDCGDWSDEETINKFQCDNETEFKCSNGRCIPRSWINDGTENCLDGADEIILNMTCTSGEYQCGNGNCLDRIFVCDGMDHCGDCSDEIEECEVPIMTRCPNDNNICIPDSFLCDSQTDCPNGAEMSLAIRGFKCSLHIGAEEKRCPIPQYSLHDEISICGDDSDVCWKNGTFHCFRCLDNRTIISKGQLCDGIFDCPDLSDECLCLKNNQTDICKLICYDMDGNGDSCSKCEVGRLSCGETCIDLEEVCDGKVQCDLDEQFCGKTAINPNNLLTHVDDFTCNDTSHIAHITALIGYDKFFKDMSPITAKMCDGIFECSRFEDECNANCEVPLHPRCSQFPMRSPTYPILGTVNARCCNVSEEECLLKFLYVLGKSICNGISECPQGEDEFNCDDRFYCNAGEVDWPNRRAKVVSVPAKSKCNLVVDCKVDKLDELNCSSDTHFYCENQNPLFIPKQAVLNGIVDCTDLSDECPENISDDVFSSRRQMIANVALWVILWLIALISTSGNITVIFKTLHHFWNNKSDRSLAKANNLMILNLAISDLLMGISLLTLGAKSVQFSGSYCLLDKAWRISSTCNFVGFLFTLSSEASMLILVGMTTIRLNSVIDPLNSRFVKMRKIVIVLCGIWACSITVSLLPLLASFRDSMATHAVASTIQSGELLTNFFQTDTISFQDYKEYVSRVSTLGNTSITNMEPSNIKWNYYYEFLNKYYRDYSPTLKGYIGYYSAHSVCLPRLYRMSDSEPLNPLTIVIISVNFMAMCFVLVAYTTIYFKTRKSGEIVDSQRSPEKANKSLQRKITILVATDFLCWFPVCITSIISMTITPVGGLVYAFAAIIQLPINSAMNPIIYSDIFSVISVNIRRWNPSTSSGEERTDSSRTHHAAFSSKLLQLYTHCVNACFGAIHCCIQHTRPTIQPLDHL